MTLRRDVRGLTAVSLALAALAAMACGNATGPPGDGGREGRGRPGELKRYLRALDPRSADGIERITVAAAAELYRAGEVVMVDVRDPDQYRAAHIGGALNIPVNEIERRLGDLPRGRRIVTYCT